MPHQCVNCGAMYGDGAKELLEGCSCGGRIFFFVKKEKVEESKKITESLSREQKKQMERDVLDLIGVRDPDKPFDQPVILDLESIRVNKPGSYELDIVNLFKKQPLIYRMEEGKYVIDLPESFKMAREKAKEKEKRKK